MRCIMMKLDHEKSQMTRTTSGRIRVNAVWSFGALVYKKISMHLPHSKRKHLKLPLGLLHMVRCQSKRMIKHEMLLLLILIRASFAKHSAASCGSSMWLIRFTASWFFITYTYMEIHLLLVFFFLFLWNYYSWVLLCENLTFVLI